MTIEKILITEEEKNNMIPYKAYIITSIIIIKLIENYFNFRQYRRLKENRPIPKELISVGLEQSKHEESQKYSLAKIKILMISNFIQNTVNILFIYYNINPIKYDIAKRLCVNIPYIKFNPENEYGPLFCFIFLEFILLKIIDLPFKLYETFIIDEKFGVNKSTLKRFIIDQIKTFILTLIILPIFITLLIYIIIKGGKYFYIFAEIFAIIIGLISIWVYPNFILPLFNNLKEIEDGNLKNGITKLAKQLNYPLKKIYEMDASQRSAQSSVYFTGLWKDKRIILYDNLIKNLDYKEIEGLTAHELGHWINWHGVFLLVISFTNFFIRFFLLQFFINEEGIYISFGFEQKSIFVGLYLFYIIHSPVSFFMNVMLNFFMRKIEYQGDKFACDLGYGDYLVKALCKLSESNKTDFDPDPFYSMVKYPRPTLIERVRAINHYQNAKKKSK